MLTTMAYEATNDNVVGSSKVYVEDINSLAFPLRIGRNIGVNNIVIHPEVGVQYNRIISSFANMESTSLMDGNVVQSSTSTGANRISNAFALTASLAIKYPLGDGQITATVTANHFLQNFVETDQRYSNAKFILDAQYIDPDFSMNSFGFNLGYQWPLRVFNKIQKIDPVK